MFCFILFYQMQTYLEQKNQQKHKKNNKKIK